MWNSPVHKGNLRKIMLFCNTCFWDLLPESFKTLNTDGQDSTSQHSVFEARAAMSMLMLLAVPMLLCMFFCNHSGSLWTCYVFLYVVSTKPKSTCIMPVSTKLNVFPPKKRSPDNSEIMIIVHYIHLSLYILCCMWYSPFWKTSGWCQTHPFFLSVVPSFFGAQWEPFSSPFQAKVGATINGHIFLVYFLGLCKGIYPHNMAKHMVQIWYKVVPQFVS